MKKNTKRETNFFKILIFLFVYEISHVEGPSPYGDARTERVHVFFFSLYDYTGKRFITKNEFSLILFIEKMMNKHTKSVIDHALTIFCVNPLAATVPYMGRFCYHMPMQTILFLLS